MATQAYKVLLVDDEKRVLKTLAQRLELLGFTPFTATNGMAAIDIALENSIDLAIVDFQMPGMDGLVTITKLKEIDPNLKTVLLTGHGNEKVKQATESLSTVYFQKDEMEDFWRFVKKMNTDGKVIVIPSPGTGSRQPPADGLIADAYPADETEFHRHHDFNAAPARSEGASPELHRSESLNRVRIVGETPAMLDLRKTISRVAPLNCTVLLCGEPGTGKELVAKAIHARSGRHYRRFLTLNCSDFENDQLVRQLLGHKSGDLYEAFRARSGIFNDDALGTLLFDQVEKLPYKTQTQLLKILDLTDRQQSGLSKEATIDIRILVATDTDLMEQIKRKVFKEDLYDRFMFTLSLPPLRERKDDIPPLCRYFFEKYRQELQKPIDSISPKFVKTLVDYDFPGNVRELAHIIERAVILADGSTIEPQHLPARFFDRLKPLTSPPPKQFSTLAEIEKRYIVLVLEATKGNKSKAAEILGISRAALWRKLKQLKAEGAVT